MTGKQVPCLTAEEALCQAMERAMDTMGEPGELTEASIGRFADLDAGWHWSLKITRAITSEHPHLRHAPDNRTKRIKLVVQAYTIALARYTEDGHGGKGKDGNAA